MSSKPDAKVARVRNIIIGAVGVIVLAIVALGLYYATDVSTPATFVEGKHYALLDQTRRTKGAPVIVREYFSYACVHCKNFDPQVEEWRDGIDTDQVKFERMPVSFSPMWGILAQSYYALASVGALSENHPRLFRAIHDNNRQFLSPEMVADFVDGHGVTRQAFLDAYRSSDVRRAASLASDLSVEQKINGVPSLTVADRYVVNLNEVPRAQAFDVVDFLVAKALAEG